MFFWRGKGENCIVKDLNSLACLGTDNYQISASWMEEKLTAEWKKMIDSTAYEDTGK